MLFSGPHESALTVAPDNWGVSATKFTIAQWHYPLSTLITNMQVLKAQVNDIWICTYPWCCWWQGAVGKWKRSHHSLCTVYLVDRICRWEKYIKIFVKCWLQQILYYVGLLVTSANNINNDISSLVWKTVYPFITWMSCVCLFAYRAGKWDPSGHSLDAC